MTRIHTRLKTLEQHERAASGIIVWQQDCQGADEFTSDKYAGVTLTRAQLDAFEDTYALRIIVLYEDLGPRNGAANTKDV